MGLENWFPKKQTESKENEGSLHEQGEQLKLKVGELIGNIKAASFSESAHSESGQELNPGSSISNTFNTEKAVEDFTAYKLQLEKIIEKCDQEEEKGMPGTPDFEVDMRHLLEDLNRAEPLLMLLQKKSEQG